MTYRRQTSFGATAFVLAFVLLGFAQTIGANDLERAAEGGGDDIEAMEEVVVIGRKKNQRPNFSRAPSIEPIVNTPGWFEWDFLPTYDSERAIRRLELLQHNHRPISRDGTIELFRISFGRRQH